MRTQRRNVAVYATLAVVLFAVTGLFVALFVVANNGAGEAHDELTTVERELADTRAHVKDVRSTVDTLGDEREKLQATNDTLRACAEPTEKGIQAAAAGDKDGLSAAIDEMLAKCVR